MRRRGRFRRPILIGVGIIVGAVLLMQLVPYGHDHGAPATTTTAKLDRPAAELARAACMDCHSNETTWPWYANVAPVSFLVVNDVKGGREHMNMSQWDHPQPDLGEIVEAIDGGEMPPLQYKLVHAGSRLSAAEKRTLIDGFRKLYASNPPPSR